MTQQSISDPEGRARLRAGVISLVVGMALLSLKFVAYSLTGSTAILSDALESIVNVVAAVFAIGGIVFAGRPADRSHPYGHGKIEYFSAAFEGGLITFAALLILYEAGDSLIQGAELRQADVGIAITIGAGVGNAILGWFLIRTGKRYNSLTLVADGKHVLTDFWSSAGVVVGLVLVLVTGIHQFDPLVAGLVGINLGLTGWRLVRQAAGGLLDEEDTELLNKVVAAMNDHAAPGIIRLHHLRAIRAGRFTHLDAHLVVPEFWTVERAHDASDEFEARVIRAMTMEGEIAFHTDPCRRHYCAICEIDNCPIRTAPFAARAPLTIDDAIKDDTVVRAEIQGT